MHPMDHPDMQYQAVNGEVPSPRGYADFSPPPPTMEPISRKRTYSDFDGLPSSSSLTTTQPPPPPPAAAAPVAPTPATSLNPPLPRDPQDEQSRINQEIVEEIGYLRRTVDDLKYQQANFERKLDEINDKVERISSTQQVRPQE